jgi:hypothetical protein
VRDLPIEPCPICGNPRKWYVKRTKRSSGPRKGQRRTRRELRDTCGRKRCTTIQRGRTTAKLLTQLEESDHRTRGP